MRTYGLYGILLTGRAVWKTSPAWMQNSLQNYSTDFIVRSTSLDVAIPTTSVTDALKSATNDWGHHTALVCGITGHSYTYSQVWDSSQRFGTSLQKLGFRQKEVLGIISPNCPEYAIAILGTIGMGGVVTAVNNNFTAEEIAHQLQSVSAKYLLTVPSLLPVIRKVKDIYSDIEEVIVVGDPEEDCIKFDDMLKEDGGPDRKHLDFDMHSTALVLASSGTTGLPKGVMLSHYNINSMIYIAEGMKVHSKSESFQEVFLCVLPMFHAYGMLVIVLLGLTIGAKIVTLPMFEPAAFVKVLEQYQPTVLHLVTPMFAFLSDYQAVQKKHFDRVHSLMYGGAPLGMSLINKLQKKMHPSNANFIEAYGMTEFLPITANPKEHFVLGSCGKVVTNTRIKIVDTETGDILGPHRTGEICAHGPQMMKGYLNNPEATAATVKDGWIHTGDVGYYDDNGYFFIVDRVKELIKVKGFQVAPSELEDILRKHPLVQDAGVIGIPDDIVGERPRAYVVRKDATLTETDVFKFTEDKVAPYKKLTGGVKFVDMLPRSAIGKILRRQLKAQALSEL